MKRENVDMETGKTLVLGLTELSWTDGEISINETNDVLMTEYPAKTPPPRSAHQGPPTSEVGGGGAADKWHGDAGCLGDGVIGGTVKLLKEEHNAPPADWGEENTDRGGGGEEEKEDMREDERREDRKSRRGGVLETRGGEERSRGWWEH